MEQTNTHWYNAGFDATLNYAPKANFLNALYNRRSKILHETDLSEIKKDLIEQYTEAELKEMLTRRRELDKDKRKQSKPMKAMKKTKGMKATKATEAFNSMKKTKRK